MGSLTFWSDPQFNPENKPSNNSKTAAVSQFAIIAQLNSWVSTNRQLETNSWMSILINHFHKHTALQVSIISLPVTMNRKIKKPPVKLNFQWSQ